jgi:hypothetical protein
MDTNWYTDTGTTNHTTRELNKLSIHEKYDGRDRVHTANCTGMEISHIGHSVLHTPDSSLHLNNILHVPNASKKISFPFISLPLIMISLLSFMLSSF